MNTLGGILGDTKVLIAKCCIRHGSNLFKKMHKQQYKLENPITEATAKKADRIYVWGNTVTGALGVKKFLLPNKKGYTRPTQFVPYKNAFWEQNNLKVKDVACGYGFSTYIVKSKDDNSYAIYGCGINTESQLGFHKSKFSLDYIPEPMKIDLPLHSSKTTQFKQISCGRAHIFINTSEGLFSLGNNSYGQCGRTIVELEKYRGSQIINKVSLDISSPIKQVECGQDHTLLLTEEGKVYSCGLNADGQCANGNYTPIDHFTEIKGDIEGEKIIHLSSKVDTILAVSDKGDLFGWGNSEYNQLSSAAGNVMQLSTAKCLPFKNVGKVVKTACAGSMCALLNAEGLLYVWGYGILGKGPNAEQSISPTIIPPRLFQQHEFNDNIFVKDIQSSIHYFAAITTDNSLFTWGKNRSGCLGLGHKLDQFFPYKVLVPAEVMKIACGVDHINGICKAFV